MLLVHGLIPFCEENKSFDHALETFYPFDMSVFLSFWKSSLLIFSNGISMKMAFKTDLKQILFFSFAR